MMLEEWFFDVFCGFEFDLTSISGATISILNPSHQVPRDHGIFYVRILDSLDQIRFKSSKFSEKNIKICKFQLDPSLFQLFAY